MKTTLRRGFTLPEILVTVTIVAVLAAVVVPAVTQQVNKGDAPSTASEVIGIRTAVNNFATDMRRFPKSLGQLTTRALSTDSLDIDGNKYADVSNFHGPYLTTDGEGLTTSLGIVFGNQFSVANNMLCMKDSADAAGSVKALPSAPAVALDAALDHGNGAATGLVTWSDSSATVTNFVKAGTLKVCLVSKS